MKTVFKSSDPFLYDRMQIVNSRAFRRLEGKTQVVSGDRNCHIRTRMTHSLEVESLAVIIAKLLSRSQSLVSAGAVGHDTAHVIFGHFGERFFSEKLGRPFRHEKFAPFVLEVVEELILQTETMRAIMYHSRGNGEMAPVGIDEWPEYDILMLADKISYILSDPEDLALIDNEAIKEQMLRLGGNRNERLWNIVSAIRDESVSSGKLSFSQGKVYRDFYHIRSWMYKEIYPEFDRWRDTNLRQTLDDLLLFFRGRYTLKESILLIALMGEDELVRLHGKIGWCGKAKTKTWESLENPREFSFLEISDKVKELAREDFLGYYTKFE